MSTIFSAGYEPEYKQGYPGSQRVLFSPLLSNPLVKLAGVFGFIPHITFKIGRKELIGC
jgi:hypothetical protein